MGPILQPHHPHLFASALLQRLTDNHAAAPRWTDYITRQILNVCWCLDSSGAWEWPYWKIAGTFAAVLWGVRMVGQKRLGVDWYAMVHALVSFVGCAAVVYLDAVASERLTGIPEPNRSLQCHAPLTSLHRILPAITMGYSLLDLFDGLFISVDFALHGAVTMLVLAYYCAIEAPHIVEPLLIVEASTVFLVLVRAEFMSDAAAALNQALFVITFFLSRCVASPYLHYRILTVLWTDDDWRSCYPGHFLPVSFVSGLFFHCLNYFWLYKIVRKVLRKMQGKEGIRANNDIADAANHKLNGDGNGDGNGTNLKKDK
jgi:TLC domain